ncbi:MAG TPA: NAD(P)-dependent alcohol dehydrogenase [Stellaceae bacterium]|nr:NAD(P)-dependent alcohol dehydrogenase [Stellaceae bacterium]
MKAYVLEAGSTSLDGLKRVERPDPSHGPREVLVRMRAASLNFRDQAVATGRYFGGPVRRDTVPLSDGAGEVLSIGDQVTRFKPGDRVAPTFFQGWIDGPFGPILDRALGSPLDGALAELAVFDQDGLVAIPPSLSFEEAACLPCAALTAWHALMAHRPLRPGETVLALGTGGVAMFALQFAHAAGARVIVTSSSDDKIARAKALGASDGINYRTSPDWEKEVMKLTGGHGADRVIELGGVGTFGRSVQAVAYGGEISLIGVLAPPGADTNLPVLMVKNAAARGIFVGSRRMFEDMNRAIEINCIAPVIDRTFPFDAAADAFRHQMTGSHMGKIVITI